MANTTSGLTLDQPNPTLGVAAPNQGFAESSPLPLNIGQSPFALRDFPNPRGAQPLTQDFALARFLGLATTNTKPFNNSDWPVPIPKPNGGRVAEWLMGRAAFTNNLLGLPGLTFAVAALMGNTTIPAQGAIGNASIIKTGGFV